MDDASSTERLIATLNGEAPPFFAILGGTVTGFDIGRRELTMTFSVGLDLCHSGDIVQGGFVTAMLDAAMAHAIIVDVGERVAIPTLDLSVSFLAPTRAGDHRAVGRVLRRGGRIAFAEATLSDDSGNITARAASTAVVASK